LFGVAEQLRGCADIACLPTPPRAFQREILFGVAEQLWPSGGNDLVPSSGRDGGRRAPGCSGAQRRDRT
jgi:hypothetical protein